MGSPSATRWEAVTVRGCHLLQSLRSFHKWYPRLPSGQPPAEVARSAVDVTLQPRYGGGEKCRGCHPPAEVWWWREVPWMSAGGCPLSSPQYRLPQRATASAGNRHWGYLIPPLHQPKADPYHEADFILRLTEERAVDVSRRLTSG